MAEKNQHSELTQQTIDHVTSAGDAVEAQARLGAIQSAIAERALDITTDPDVTQREAGEATQLYGKTMGAEWDVSLGSSEESDEASSAETDPWSMLSPERAVFARKAISAMAEKLDVAEADFDLVRVTYDDSETIEALYSAAEPLFAGTSSRDSLRYEIEKSGGNIVTIDGQEYDTTKAMNLSSYRALAEQAERQGKPLTDRSNTSKGGTVMLSWNGDRRAVPVFSLNQNGEARYTTMGFQSSETGGFRPGIRIPE